MVVAFRIRLRFRVLKLPCKCWWDDFNENNNMEGKCLLVIRVQNCA